MLQTLSGSINSVWVGQFLGGSALAATANANIIMFLMFATFFGFGMAATVLIGQAIGRGDTDAARRATGAVVGLALIFSLVIAIVGWFASTTILHWLKTPPEAFDLAHDYLRVTFIAIPASMLAVTLMMASRGAGDAVTPLRFMLLSVVLDIALNPLLILGIGPFPRLGIAGSALATAIAGTISLIAMLGWFYARDHVLRLRGPELKYLLPNMEELRFIIGKGLPMGAQMLVISGAGLVMVEATAVERRGRISPGDSGLYDDKHVEPLARIARFIREQGIVAGIQLAHAGRKASVHAPWLGGKPLEPTEGAWETVSASAVPFDIGWHTPQALSRAEIEDVVAAWVAATRRALAAGDD